jgi:isoleucyl-tRNA synthetase
MLVLDAYGTPVPLVDLQGKFTSHVGEYAGKYVKTNIIILVKHQNAPLMLIAIRLKKKKSI